MDTRTGITVHFEDCGQDFLEFDIKEGLVIAARPFQNDIWAGKVVLNEDLAIGSFISLQTDWGVRPLLYPIIDIHPMETPVQIGPTDV